MNFPHLSPQQLLGAASFTAGPSGQTALSAQAVQWLQQLERPGTWCDHARQAMLIRWLAKALVRADGFPQDRGLCILDCDHAMQKLHSGPAQFWYSIGCTRSVEQPAGTFYCYLRRRSNHEPTDHSPRPAPRRCMTGVGGDGFFLALTTVLAADGQLQALLDRHALPAARNEDMLRQLLVGQLRKHFPEVSEQLAWEVPLHQVEQGAPVRRIASLAAASTSASASASTSASASASAAERSIEEDSTAKASNVDATFHPITGRVGVHELVAAHQAETAARRLWTLSSSRKRPGSPLPTTEASASFSMPTDQPPGPAATPRSMSGAWLNWPASGRQEQPDRSDLESGEVFITGFEPPRAVAAPRPMRVGDLLDSVIDRQMRAPTTDSDAAHAPHVASRSPSDSTAA
ncbi:hypothetical protein [Roseateles amylovorans]|uniref:Uncharacterized protein n=1 Tax=Roseateles amylovorans TaxID=2978473 RepID=A0ABY6B978_9BURK|nr:hypothetical protein [Roseateles amylovorans]UXH80466.1 hypothetical protein N4261_11580 [Roseateles amylovorans]